MGLGVEGEVGELRTSIGGWAVAKVEAEGVGMADSSGESLPAAALALD